VLIWVTYEIPIPEGQNPTHYSVLFVHILIIIIDESVRGICSKSFKKDEKEEMKEENQMV